MAAHVERPVPDIQTDIVAFLRAAFATEAAANFPRLRRIPQTKVVQFLDYFADLGPDARSWLLLKMFRYG